MGHIIEKPPGCGVHLAANIYQRGKYTMQANDLSTVESQSRAFNIGDAKRYGVDAAIIIANIRYWMIENRARNHNVYDNKVWTYNSATSWAELFPFWSANKIQKTIRKMEKDGLLLVGNYNKIAYDRTKWYSLPDFVFMGQEKHQANEIKPLSQMAESNKQEGSTYTNINTDINTDIKTLASNSFEGENLSNNEVCFEPWTENPSTANPTQQRRELTKERVNKENISGIRSGTNVAIEDYQYAIPNCEEMIRVMEYYKGKGFNLYTGGLTKEEWSDAELQMNSIDCFDHVGFITYWIEHHYSSMRKAASLSDIVSSKNGIEFEQYHNAICDKFDS
jgi:hypothetical protein